jgi:hypothetical protein
MAEQLPCAIAASTALSKLPSAELNSMLIADSVSCGNMHRNTATSSTAATALGTRDSEVAGVCTEDGRAEDGRAEDGRAEDGRVDVLEGHFPAAVADRFP